MKIFKKAKGFTLIELMIVIGIIALLISVVMVALNNARNKGLDAGVKSNLVNAARQAEIFYNTNTAVPNAYTGVCTNPGPVGGAVTVAALMTAAASAAGLSSYAIDAIGTATTATCNQSAGAWASEVPLKTTNPAANQMWCVDNTGKSMQKTGSSLSAINDYTCS
jgi:prepilin-type N-terminal cleavage/methylation domain-containing protein